MKILVTGGSGFIGSHLMRQLKLNSDYKVENYDLVEGNDIRNFPQLTGYTKDTEAIVHLAALIRVAECELKPKETLETNLIGTSNVLESARINDCEIVFASSAAVYGMQERFPISEDAESMPASIYAISKLGAEQLVQLYRGQYGLKITIFRIFNVYGSGQDPCSPYAAVIPIFIEQALQNKNLIIYGNGKQTRDFIYIRNVAEALEQALHKNPNQTINLASGQETSILQLAEIIKELTNSKSQIKFAQPRACDIKKSIADITKLKELGFISKYSLKEGLEETINWFKNRI